jgi:O-methyltransferase|tara:strand:- start:1830 stop:2582 length:753 start_codon:yes stop_codon:yes gene_type:complete
MINHVYGNKKINILKNFKKFIESFIRVILSFFYKFNNNQKIIISSAMYAPWIADKKFFKLFSELKDLTIIDEARAFTLWYISQSLKNTSGDIFDIGCMKGGAGILMTKANKNSQSKTLFIDTFDGFAKTSGEHKKNKTFVYEKTDELKNNLKKYKIKNCKIIKSRFPKNFKFKNKIKLCHLDINVYEDTVNAFMEVDKHLIKNGVIVFDDYGIFKVDEIIKSIQKIIKKKYDKKYHIIYNYMGQCIMIKK